MPMDFPDLRSLKFTAKIHKFRPILNGETEEQYREALANHVMNIDRVESAEIRYSIGWDKWTDQQKKEELNR